MSEPLRVLTGLLALATVGGALFHREMHWRIKAAGWAEAAAKRDAAPASPPPEVPAESHSTLLETQAAALAQNTELTRKLQLIEAENRDLRDRLTKLLEAPKPAPTPSGLAVSLESQRELTFRQMPAWSPATVDDILTQIRSGVEAALPEDAAKVRARAAVTLGLHTDLFDYREAFVSLSQMQAGGIYDPAENRLYYQMEASLERADGREAFIGGLVPALLRQNFPLAEKNWLVTDNDDAARAAESLIHGDANATRVRFSISDQANLNFDRNGAPVPAPPTYDAPVYLAETWKFTHDKGSQFIEALQASGGTAAVNAAYTRPPRSTAEIIHPELYLATPPFVPVEVPLPAGPVAGKDPLFTNVAGELGIYILLRAWCDMDLSSDASTGWLGDRFALYPGSEEYGDSLYWKTLWTSPEDATAFFQAMRRILMQRYSIPWQAEYDTVPDTFAVSDPHRVIRLVRQPDGRTVTLLNSPDPAFAAALETAAATW